MSSNDLTSIFISLSHSLAPIQKLVSGSAYVLGILFVMYSLSKFKKIADAQANSNSHDPIFAPLAFLFFGSGLCYFPTFCSVMSNTFFGVNNVLQYTSTNPVSFYTSVVRLIQTAGMVWFVRGSVLVAQASSPGKQHGYKGMVYLISGVLAINYYSTAGALYYSMQLFMTAVQRTASAAGY